MHRECTLWCLEWYGTVPYCVQIHYVPYAVVVVLQRIGNKVSWEEEEEKGVKQEVEIKLYGSNLGGPNMLFYAI